MIALATPRVAVAVFRDGTPNQAEWAAYLETLRELGDGQHRTLVFSAGGGPSPLQRKDLERMTEEQDDVRVAVITRSMVARGMVTALRWFRRDANAAFDTTALDDAMDYLELDELERHAASELASQLARDLGVTKECGL